MTLCSSSPSASLGIRISSRRCGLSLLVGSMHFRIPWLPDSSGAGPHTSFTNVKSPSFSPPRETGSQGIEGWENRGLTNSRGCWGNGAEADGRGEEEQVVGSWARPRRSWGFRAGLRRGRRPEGSGTVALMEIVHRRGFRLGGIEHGALVEVVGEGFLGDLLCFPTDGAHGELDLGWSPGGMGEGGRSGLSDMGQDLCDGSGSVRGRSEAETAAGVV